MNPIDAILKKAAGDPRTIVLPEGEDRRVIVSAAEVLAKGLAKPILIGNRDAILKQADSLNTDLEGAEIIDHLASGKIPEYASEYLKIQEASGKNTTPEEAEQLIREPVYFGAMMVRLDEADGMVAGAVNYSATVMRAAYRIIGLSGGGRLFSSFFIVTGCKPDCGEDGALIFADASVVPYPSSEQLAEIAAATARSTSCLLGWDPRVAMLSFSTKGSSKHESVDKVIRSVEIAREKYPDLKVDGELQGDAALSPEVAANKKTGGGVAGRANVLIFPNLDAGNISYKLIQHLGGADCYGPILQGFAKPVNDLSRGAKSGDITVVVGITTVQAQNRQKT